MPRDDDSDHSDLAAREERAAAAEAGRIGGAAPDAGAVDGDDPLPEAQLPVQEAGGGEAEGFELAERDLVRNASHDDGRAFPERDGFSTERDADRSGAEYAEADDESGPDR